MADTDRTNVLMQKRQKGTLTPTEKDELIRLLIKQLQNSPGRTKVSA